MTEQALRSEAQDTVYVLVNMKNDLKFFLRGKEGNVNTKLLLVKESCC